MHGGCGVQNAQLAERLQCSKGMVSSYCDFRLVENKRQLWLHEKLSLHCLIDLRPLDAFGNGRRPSVVAS